MNNKILILLAVIVIVFVVAAQGDIFSGGMDLFGKKNSPKPGGGMS